MRYDEKELSIREALETIRTPEYDFTQDVKRKINSASPHKVVYKRYKKARFILIAGIVGLLSITVLGGTLTSFNRLLALISPEIAAILKPINKSEEEGQIHSDEVVDEMQNIEINSKEHSNGGTEKAKGIEIKPLAVVNDHDMLVVYLTMQDLTGNRLDETMSIYDYFVEGTTINNCQVIDYEPTTKTAILRLQGNGGSELEKDKIRICIKSFLSHKQEVDSVETNIGLSKLPHLREVDSAKLFRDFTSGGGGTGELWNEIENKGYIGILKVANKNISVSGIKGMTISNIGFVDNKLHIQTKWSENNGDNNGYFYLVDKAGDKVDVLENNFYFGVDESNNIQFGGNYIEYILDISPEEIGDLELRGYFVEWDELVEGGWQVIVDLNTDLQIITLPCDIQIESWSIEEIEVSPLGVTLIGEGIGKRPEVIDVSIKLKNGEVKTFDNVMTSNQLGKVSMKLGLEIPLDMDEVMQVEINHNVISFE